MAFSFPVFYELPYSHLIYVGVIGLCVGSFLNVMIARIPKDMSLWTPNSHCPQCQRSLRWCDNIPFLSYVTLKGQCRYCRGRISPRYPLVEIVTSLLSMLIAFHFGVSAEMASALLLTWGLIALAFIDLEHLLLPDAITLPLLWLGLLLSVFHLFTTPENAIIGAITGYLSLWSVYWIFKIVTHKEGMGYGDFKLLAVLGAWLGWQALPFIVLFSSTIAVVVGLSLIILKKQDRNTPIPFGPFLALAGVCALLFGDKTQLFLFIFLDNGIRDSGLGIEDSEYRIKDIGYDHRPNRRHREWKNHRCPDISQFTS